MFTYCLNNPVMCFDPSGNACIMTCNGPVDLFTRDICGFTSMGRGTTGGAAKRKYPKQEHTFDTGSEEDVKDSLEEYGFAVYNDTLVLMTDLPFEGSAFSYGIIVFDDAYEYVSIDSFENTLKHEYGHAVHFQMVGAEIYTIMVAIPSLAGAGLSYICPFISENYYSLPWERIADQLGSASNEYLPGANTFGSLYWIATIICSNSPIS